MCREQGHKSQICVAGKRQIQNLLLVPGDRPAYRPAVEQPASPGRPSSMRALTSQQTLEMQAARPGSELALSSLNLTGQWRCK